MSIANIQDRTERLRSALMEADACLVGFADLSCLDANVTKGYPFGISFALQYDLDAVDSLPNAELFSPMKAAIEEKAKKLNKPLKDMTLAEMDVFWEEAKRLPK